MLFLVVKALDTVTVLQECLLWGVSFSEDYSSADF